MPHVSKKLLDDKTKQTLEKRVIAFLSDTGGKTRKQIFREMFTKTERMMIAKRLGMLYLISNYVPTNSISKLLNVSPSTVARFEASAENGDYKTTAAWLLAHKRMNSFLKLILDLAAVPFEARKKSLGKLMDEIYK